MPVKLHTPPTLRLGRFHLSMPSPGRVSLTAFLSQTRRAVDPFLQERTLAQGRHSRVHTEIRKGKDQGPVRPVQISEVISPHLVGDSLGDGRVDTVSTSDLSQRPPDVDNEGTISQPGCQCRDKEANVDPDT